jgi:hypothetical protein
VLDLDEEVVGDAKVVGDADAVVDVDWPRQILDGQDSPGRRRPSRGHLKSTRDPDGSMLSTRVTEAVQG